MSQPTERLEWECPHCFQLSGIHLERCPMKHAREEPAAPVIHMNGTGYTNLYWQYQKAMDALRDATEALIECSPNGRDYYVQPTGTMERAQYQHFARLRLLAGIRAEIEYIMMKISEQESARGNR